MASRRLVKLAKDAANATAKAAQAQRDWAAAFEAEFGHCDISDSLVEIIEYGRGGPELLTAKFIDANSKPGMS